MNVIERLSASMIPSKNEPGIFSLVLFVGAESSGNPAKFVGRCQQKLTTTIIPDLLMFAGSVEITMRNIIILLIQELNEMPAYRYR